MTDILFKESYAQSTDNPNSSNDAGVFSFLPLILIFAIFYLLLIRPQQKKHKEQQEMINNLKIGDMVYTFGGIVGKVDGIDTEKNIVELEISKGVVIKVIRANIAALYTDKKEQDNNKDKVKKKIANNK